MSKSNLFKLCNYKEPNLSFIPTLTLKLIKKQTNLCKIIKTKLISNDLLLDNSKLNFNTNVDDIKPLQSQLQIVDVYKFSNIISCNCFNNNEIIYDFLTSVDVIVTKSIDSNNEPNIVLIRANITLLDNEMNKNRDDYELLLESIHILDIDVNYNDNNDNFKLIDNLSFKSNSIYSKQSTRYYINIHAIPYFIKKILLFFSVLYIIKYFNILLISNDWIYYITIILLLILISLYIYYIITITLLKNNSISRVFFMNGWNAWSFTGSVDLSDPPPIYSMPSLFVKSFHNGSPAIDINMNSYDKLFITCSTSYIASDMFTIISKVNKLINKNCGLLIGFLTQKKQYGYITSNSTYSNASIYCDCDDIIITTNNTITTDWLYIEITEKLFINPLDFYMLLVSKLHSKPIDVNIHTNDQNINSSNQLTIPCGWCSWYHFYENISDNILINNLTSFLLTHKKYHILNTYFNLFQIDDGYQLYWGDWLQLNPSKFPHEHSIKEIIDQINEENLIPGIWLAPFSCDIQSNIYKSKSDWVIKKSKPLIIYNNLCNLTDTTMYFLFYYLFLNNKPANSANCGKFFYGFDITKKEVQDHIKSILSVIINKWGVKYLKLDFLYSVVLRDGNRSYSNRYITRAEIMQLAMKLINEVVKENHKQNDIFILGCGAPIGSIIGHVHANRVSADAGLQWKPPFPLPSNDKWNLPSARSMLRNTIVRSAMHNKWWINDPDCILLRQSTLFSIDEIIALATIKAISGGSFILSDDIDSLSINRLRILQKCLPPNKNTFIPIDLLYKEIPENLQLTLTNESKKWIVSCLCNWDDYKKSNKSFYFIELLKPILIHQTILYNERHHLLIHLFDFWEERYNYMIVSYTVTDGRDESSHKNTDKPSYIDSDIIIYSIKMLNDEIVIYDDIAPNNQILISRSRSEKIMTYLLHRPSDKKVYSEHVDRDIVNDNILSDITITRSNKLNINNILPHSIRLISFTPHMNHNEPVYIGSNLHYSCGLEVKSLTYTSNNCSISFNKGYLKDKVWKGYIWIYLPYDHEVSNQTHLPIVTRLNHEEFQEPHLSNSIIKITIVNDDVTNVHGIVWALHVYLNDSNHDHDENKIIIHW